MDEIFTEIDKAQYELVKKHTAAKIAKRMAMSPHVLASKVNPNTNTHHLRLDEAVAIQLITGETDILKAEAQTLGYALYKIPDELETNDQTILEAWAAWHAEIGETAQKIKDALEDNIVTKKELAGIIKEIHEDAAKAMELLQVLQNKSETDQ